MYWSDWEAPVRIERATLDGENRSVFLSNIGRAIGLTIDFNANKIYWSDLDENRIMSVDMEGKNEQVLVSQMVHHTYSLTQYDDFIYWAGQWLS